MNDLSDVIGFIIALLFLIVFIPVIFLLVANLTEYQCQPYIQQIQQKDTEINALKQQIAQLNQQLEEYKQRYAQLKNETITKEDIEEIKHYFNTTQTQINLLNQKFDIVNNNFITAYNTYFYVFKFSVILNIVLAAYIALDLINLALFNTSLNMRIINRLRIVFKRNK